MTMTTTQPEHWFGLKPDPGVDTLATWGARALVEESQTPTVYRSGPRKGQTKTRKVLNRGWMESQKVYTTFVRLVLLPDRQQAEGEGDNRRQLITWLNDKADAKLQEWVRKMGRGVTYSNQSFTFSDGQFVLKAAGRGGYVYVGAWMKEG